MQFNQNIINRDGHILERRFISTRMPSEILPIYFAFVHTVASNSNYYSNGNLRKSENHCIFHYTLKGKGRCYNGFSEDTVCEGQGFLSIINDPQSGYYYPKDQTGDWEFVCFCFEGGNCMDIVRKMIADHGQIFYLPQNDKIITDLMTCPPSLSAYESSRYFFNLFGKLVKYNMTSSDTVSSGGMFHPHIISAQKYISEHIEENPSTSEIAERLGLSREHLSRLFKFETGDSLSDYIRNQRTYAACNLLKNTDLSISEISEKLNFSSEANFIRFFKDVLTITPGIFRRDGSMPFSSGTGVAMETVLSATPLPHS